MDPVAERVARNDATFRQANEVIEAAAQDSDVEPVPFLCECAAERCMDVVMLTIEEYEHVRRDPTWFLNVPGHEANAQGWARVIERHGSYLVAQKIGEAAELVTELDSREERIR